MKPKRTNKQLYVVVLGNEIEGLVIDMEISSIKFDENGNVYAFAINNSFSLHKIDVPEVKIT